MSTAARGRAELHLDPAAVARTADRLCRRIDERFPASGGKIWQKIVIPYAMGPEETPAATAP
jgi:hypothetical protein